VAASGPAACREGDLAARYGGEEFVVLFHGLPATEAATAAELIRRTVEDYPWDGVAPGLV
jgi:GGDEF domain-containing protein